MNEKTMTLEELCQYAQEAKEQTEKEVEAERQDRIAKKNEAFSSIIKNTIDMLKEKKGQEVRIMSTGTTSFKVDEAELETQIVMNLEEIETKIGLIPALKADMHEADTMRFLKVKFSETVATDTSEADGSEDK